MRLVATDLSAEVVLDALALHGVPGEVQERVGAVVLDRHADRMSAEALGGLLLEEGVEPTVALHVCHRLHKVFAPPPGFVSSVDVLATVAALVDGVVVQQVARCLIALPAPWLPLNDVPTALRRAGTTAIVAIQAKKALAAY